VNCTGPCDQGRKTCPHHEQCEQQDGVPLLDILCALLWPIGFVAAVAIGAALW
jgi:hypothetical protein